MVTVPGDTGLTLEPVSTSPKRRILVIKLGALGDFIHAFHAFAAIRAHHAADHVTLLTTKPFQRLAEAAPWFDDVQLDRRAPWWNLPAIRRTVRFLGGFDFVYDLQTSSRSSRYFRLSRRPPWSGIAPGCAFPHANPERDLMHTIERQREQLWVAGVTDRPIPERDWLIAHGQTHGIAGRYALLMPGGAGLGAVKRWPAERYAGIAAWLHARGIVPVLIGGTVEAPLAQVITAACPQAVDLTTKTTVEDLAALGAGAGLVVGNDTGPVHIAASVGAPTVVLFSGASVPEQAASRGPNGEWATVVQKSDLKDLTVAEVIAAIESTVTV